MIVLFCAMDSEFEALHRQLAQCKPQQIVENCVIGYQSANNDTVLLVKTGVGKAAAERCAGWCLRRYTGVELVVSCGIAGALNPALSVGEIILGDGVWDYRADTSCRRLPWRTSPQWYTQLCGIAEKRDKPIRCRRGSVLSSDVAVSDRTLRDRLFKTYGADCVEMECAGTAHVCAQYGVSLLAIKGISDHADSTALLSVLRSQRRVMDALGQVVVGLLHTPL